MLVSIDVILMQVFLGLAPSRNYPNPKPFQCTNQRPTDETECRFMNPAPFLGSARVNDTSHYKQIIQFKIYRVGEYVAPTAGNVVQRKIVLNWHQQKVQHPNQ